MPTVTLLQGLSVELSGGQRLFRGSAPVNVTLDAYNQSLVNAGVIGVVDPDVPGPTVPGHSEVVTVATPIATGLVPVRQADGSWAAGTPGSGLPTLDFGAKLAATFASATLFIVEAGATSGAQVKAILARAATQGLAVDIWLLPGTHVWNAQPTLAADQPWSRLRGSGKAVTTVQTQDATAFSVGNEGGGERLLDFKVTADYQTFGNVVVEDLTVDVQGSFGHYGAGHVVIGTQRFTTIQQRLNVKNVWVRNVNTINVPNDPTGTQQRSNVSFYVHHPASNEATQNTLTNIHVENCNFSGGAVGVLVGGHAGAAVPATSKVQANVFCDDIFIRGLTFDQKAVFTGLQKFIFCAGIQVGDRGYGGRVVIEDCRISNVIDVGVELDSILDAQVTDVDVIDCRGPSQIATNYNDTAPNQAAQRILYTRCKSRSVNLTDGVLKAGVATTNGSPTIVVPDNAGLQDGQVISGPGIPYNTTIATGGISGNNITMSVNATATAASVAVNFATWQPKGFMLGVYANSQGATAPLGHVTYRSCEWHHAGKTNLTKGEVFYSQGTQLRTLVVDDFKLIADATAIGTVTLSQSLFWCWVAAVDASGRASVVLRDVYARLQGTTAGGEVRVLALGGGHFEVEGPTFSQDLTGATTTFFPITLAQDGTVQGRISGFKTEKMTFNAGWGYYGIRTDGGGTLKDMLYEDCDFTQYSALTADVDRIISFNTDAQAAGAKYRNIRGPGAINGYDRTKVTANKTLRDWEEFVVLGAAALVVTLPKAARIAPGRIFRVKDEFGSGGTIAVQGTDTLDGVTGAAAKAVAANASVSAYSANADVAGKLFTV